MTKEWCCEREKNRCKGKRTRRHTQDPKAVDRWVAGSARTVPAFIGCARRLSFEKNPSQWM